MSNAVTPSYFYPLIYTSLLRDATENKDISLELTAQPYPLSGDLQKIVGFSLCIPMVFFFSTAFSTIFSNIAADLVLEKNEHIKHQLIVSGTS